LEISLSALQGLPYVALAGAEAEICYVITRTASNLFGKIR